MPAPDVVESAPDESELMAMLCAGARTLEGAGAEVLAVACNSVHAFWNAIAQSVSVPVLDLAEETVAVIRGAGLRSTSTSDLFQGAGVPGAGDGGGGGAGGRESEVN